MTRIAKGLEQARGWGRSAVAIGNFDSVHAGHRVLLRATVKLARKLGATPSVLTFDPHPACIVAPDRAPRMLFTLEERCAALEAEGIEAILVLPFTVDVARLTPEEFVASILCGALRAAAVVVGENFRFGHKKAGDARVLADRKSVV